MLVLTLNYDSELESSISIIKRLYVAFDLVFEVKTTKENVPE